MTSDILTFSLTVFMGFFAVMNPLASQDFMGWTIELMHSIKLEPQVKISDPISHLYFMKQSKGEQEVYFFVNADRKREVEFDA